MGFLRCSDFLLAFQQNTSELRTREWLEESMSKLHREVFFLLQEVEERKFTLSQGHNQGHPLAEPDLIATLNLLALGSLKYSSLGSGLCADELPTDCREL